jgi:hypothetical protein
MSSLAVGGPLGTTGSWGWDWWALVGAGALFVLLVVGRRRPPMFLAVAVSVVGGLILSDLTRAWGVVPVWGTFLLVALTRNLIVGGRHSQV